MATPSGANYARWLTYILVGVAATAMMAPFLVPMAMGGIFAVLVHPIFLKLRARRMKQGRAALVGTIGGYRYVEFVGKGAGEHVYRFRIGPTERTPTLERCLASLRTQPGVTGVAAAG